MCRPDRVAVIRTVAVALAFIAAACDRLYVMGRRAPLSTWPDPACINRALRAAPPFETVYEFDPSTSEDNPPVTRYSFSVSDHDTHLSIWLETDAQHQHMNLDIRWSAVNRTPSDTQLKQINALMDQIEEHIGACSGAPLPSAYKAYQSW